MKIRIACAVMLLLAASAVYGQSDYFQERATTSISIRVFPNPAPEYVNVHLGDLKVDHVHVTLHTVIGNEAAVEVERVDDHQLRLKVKDLPSGYYFISLRDDDTKFRGTYKFLKR